MRGDRISNAVYEVEAVDGRIVVRAGAREIADLIGFESCGERGDLYTHSPIPDTTRHGRLRRARVTGRGPLRSEPSTWWDVPTPESRVPSARRSVVSLT
ncbi:MAG: hypothetical protein U0163_02045 [Gemmatimonadaceae bacterium]